jgi:hypothetical protein
MTLTTFHFLERLTVIIVVLQRKRECQFYGINILILGILFHTYLKHIPYPGHIDATKKLYTTKKSRKNNN